MTTVYAKINAIVTKEHRDKVKLFSYHSGKSISEIIRMAIDKLDPKDFEKK